MMPEETVTPLIEPIYQDSDDDDCICCGAHLCNVPPQIVIGTSLSVFVFVMMFSLLVTNKEYENFIIPILSSIIGYLLPSPVFSNSLKRRRIQPSSPEQMA